ncbi:acylphosphatase [Nanoarchaeota archaeon]
MALRIIITGNVQGVFFRTFIRSRANELGLRGLVRNLEDGTVEVIVQGQKEALDELLKKCKKGPLIARVDKIETKKVEDQDFSSFEIKY